MIQDGAQAEVMTILQEQLTRVRMRSALAVQEMHNVDAEEARIRRAIETLNDMTVELEAHRMPAARR